MFLMPSLRGDGASKLNVALDGLQLGHPVIPEASKDRAGQELDEQ